MKGFVGFLEETLIDATDITADVNSRTVDMALHEHYSCQVVWTSTTASASVKMQESNDGVTWSDIGAAATQAISDDSGDIMFSSNIFEAGLFESRYIRVICDHSSGTVTSLTCKFFAKP